MNQVTLKVVSYAENSSDIQFIRGQVYHLEQGIELYRVFDEYVTAHSKNQGLLRTR